MRHRLLQFVAVLALALPAGATTVYLSQPGGSVSCGGTTQSTISVAAFNSGTQVAGNTYVVCGTITTAVAPSSNGSSGNVITLLFDSASSGNITLGSCPSTGCLNLAGLSYWLVNGGTACGTTPGNPVTSWLTTCASNVSGTGVIQATSNGSVLATQNLGYGINLGSNCHDVEIKNLIVKNIYQKSGADDSSAAQGSYAINADCGTNVLVHDSYVSGARADIYISFVNGNNNAQAYNNALRNAVWGILEAPGNTGEIATNAMAYDNDINLGTAWSQADGFYHLDGIFFFGQSNTGYLNGSYIYSNYLWGNWVATGSGQCPTGYIYANGWLQNLYVFNNIFNITGGNSCNGLIATGYSNASQWLLHNTFVGYGTGDGIALGDAAANGSSSTQMTNNVVVNMDYNVNMYHGGGSAFTTVDYNAWYNWNPTGGWTISSGVYETSFSAWQATTCGSALCDIHGAQSNPSLTASFGPTTGSPLISSGANLYSLCSGQPNPGLGALCFDQAGNARNNAPFTKGALNATVVAAPTSLVAMNVWAVPFLTSNFSSDGLTVACANGSGTVDSYFAANIRATVLPEEANCVDQTSTSGPYATPSYTWTGTDALANNYLNTASGGSSANATYHLVMVVQHQANSTLSPPGYTPHYVVQQSWADQALCGSVNSPLSYTWSAGATYYAGWQICIPISGTNYFFQTLNATSCHLGSVEPSYTIGGTNITDGSCVFNYYGTHARPQDTVTNACNSAGNYGFVAPWQVSSTYAVGNQVAYVTPNSTSACYVVTAITTGVSGTSSCFQTANTCGATVTDGGVTWAKETNSIAMSINSEAGAPDTCTGCGSAGAASVVGQNFFVPFEQPYLVWTARINRDSLNHFLGVTYGPYIDYVRLGYTMNGEHTSNLMSNIETNVMPSGYQTDAALKTLWLGGADTLMSLNSAWWTSSCENVAGCNLFLMSSVNCGTGLIGNSAISSTGTDCDYATQEALYASSLPGYTVGSDGVAGFQCAACTEPSDLYQMAGGAPTSNGTNLWHPLLWTKTPIMEQTSNCSQLVTTCPQPAGGSAVGDLRVILAFGSQLKTNIWELYRKDYLCAYEGTSCSVESSYLQAIVNASQGLPAATGSTVGAGKSVGQGRIQ